MRRLTLYLARLFAIDALILFGVVCFLLWMVQCLRIFDTVSVKGQSLFTLAWQGVLAMPPLVLTFAFVCVGIGLARALVALQSNHELHIIHTSRGLGDLFRAAGVVAILGAVGVLIISNFLAPLANRQLNTLNAAITADLVSSTLRPGRFMQVTPGVVLLIGGRAENGEITEFFADDRRDPQVRRTYIAAAATVAQTDAGYVLQLREGTLQSRGPGNRFSEVTFGQYNINVDRFTQPTAEPDPVRGSDSVTLVRQALETGTIEPRTARILTERMGEGLRVIGICLMVVAISAFPSGRRGGLPVRLPMEVVVLFIAFVDLAVSSYGLLGPQLGAVAGAVLMLVIGAIALLVRARPRHVAPLPAAAT
ncbi:hypothetical protein VE25_01885 [Devosia geojensis]|uniref:Permease n=1 Tax=Devosia geojensis TaxID=443610 RepID=A0A0F5FXB4_9HYPH|nr:LptF/LptG family permease [Devosia geojensis]KKB13499.1 hypothetical protein VE25_01885 [Devosia geojensis]